VAGYCRSASAVAVSSGTDAILCSLMTLGVGPGDEVILPTFTFFATAGCVWRVGAKPVFVDIEPDTFNIAPAKIEAAVTEKTKAIIPVHLYGQMADMEAIMGIADSRGIYVIEDAAQAIGACQGGRMAGAVGTVGCLSFYPTKNLGGIGDGGMILTDDAELAERLAVFRNHGESTRYHHKWVGGNFRMDSVQAAALSVKLGHLDRWTGARVANAARYDELLAGAGGIVTPIVRDGSTSVYNQYVIRAKRRDELQGFLKDHDVGAGIYYPLCLHEQECFASLGCRRGGFAESERACEEVLALPIFPELTDEQIVYVADKVKEFVA
jgi:dTDP-4-amino-4,6-dideoxygalactose transaminase